MKINYNIKVLIPAAGKGSRSNLSYPKTLFKVVKKPILVRIINKIKHIDNVPIIIVSKNGKKLIQNSLSSNNLNFELLEQNIPNGMGDAILKVINSKFYKKMENILVIWGDLPFLTKKTINTLIEEHFKNNYDFTFPTLKQKNPYTYLKKDKKGNILELIETRELNKAIPKYGERDIGVFIFKKKILKVLEQNLSGKRSLITKEHGFLYIIKHLISKNFLVKNLLIAQKKEAISLNKTSDLK